METMKYKEWLHKWLELYERETVKPRTYKQYENIINKRLIPALGEYEMEELTPIILQRYVVELSKKGNAKTGAYDQANHARDLQKMSLKRQMI